MSKRSLLAILIVSALMAGVSASGAGVWIALVVVVVILGGAFMARRGKASEDTE